MALSYYIKLDGSNRVKGLIAVPDDRPAPDGYTLTTKADYDAASVDAVLANGVYARPSVPRIFTVARFYLLLTRDQFDAVQDLRAAGNRDLHHFMTLGEASGKWEDGLFSIGIRLLGTALPDDFPIAERERILRDELPPA